MGAYMSPQHLPPHRAGGGLAPIAGRLALDTALAAGAALRVTRFATRDDMGGRVPAELAKRCAARRDPAQAPPVCYTYLTLTTNARD